MGATLSLGGLGLLPGAATRVIYHHALPLGSALAVPPPREREAGGRAAERRGELEPEDVVAELSLIHI